MAVRVLSSEARTSTLLFQSLHSLFSRPLSELPLSVFSSQPSLPYHRHYFNHFSTHPAPSVPTPAPPPLSPSVDDINEISRILSDFRGPHHDIENALNPFSSKINTHLVEQVLKRTKNLGFSAHRFFLWAREFADFQPTVTSYKILISVLGSSKQFPLIWVLVSEIRDTENFGLSSELFWVIFWSYCKANLPNDAIRAFNRMVDFGLKPSLNEVDHLLYLLCKRKFITHAQEFFDKVKMEITPSVKSYTILIRGWGDVGDSGGARKVFEEMLERGCEVDVPAYNSLLEALYKGGNLDEAYELFREMGSKGLKADACTYSIFIRAYCEANNVYSVFRVLDRMSRCDLLPNLYTYNCIIKKLCENKKVEEAYQLLNEMIKREVNPDTWSYNAIQAYHCTHFEVTRALRLVTRMEKENCMPDRHTYNMLLKMLIRVGRFDKVQDVWDRMDARGFYPSVSTYAVMIHGLLKKKHKLEEACKYFEIMIDEGIPPYTTTCEMLRNRLVGLGLWDQIGILVDKMERSTSCSIQELSKMVRGDRGHWKFRRVESPDLSEDEYDLDSGSNWMAPSKSDFMLKDGC